MRDVREVYEQQQDVRKEYADTKRKPSASYQEGDLVLVKTHVLSNASKVL